MIPKSITYVFCYTSGATLVMVDDFTDTYASQVHDFNGRAFSPIVSLEMSHFLAEVSNPNVRALYVIDNWE